jgi:hypothetical protein
MTSYTLNRGDGKAIAQLISVSEDERTNPEEGMKKEAQATTTAPSSHSPPPLHQPLLHS